ncbi:hypothetical protein ACIP2Y_10630 [Streptomyces sviceus]|uniref:right-handed parallel beta-helix repeat-containing protein n=1 Tax=Streptomyces sviceus TaxID=285530 RepID=UPI003808FEA7
MDSYGNRDPRKNGESADGLAIKEGSGTGNVVRGARLWNNVDDGFDDWKFTSPVLIENTIAYGNGFKLGGGSPAPAVAHTLRDSIAFKNAAHGVTDNGNTGALALTRNSTWANGGTGFDADVSGGKAKLTANPSVADAKAALSTDPAPLTGARGADGSLPSAPSFLVPRSGAAVGARF